MVKIKMKLKDQEWFKDLTEEQRDKLTKLEKSLPKRAAITVGKFLGVFVTSIISLLLINHYYVNNSIFLTISGFFTGFMTVNYIVALFKVEVQKIEDQVREILKDLE